ncbi:MAG TPA: ACP S-malonyltransferase [Acidimicrobiales bacterium]|nr:ACP S-malonyltransferase [Acidimicrobiales bacterium]
MLAFTFPGQGSQRPGMGRPWVDHPSWELVADASEAAERDVAFLLLEAGADELTATRNAQLATFTLSLVALDAIERVGIEPRWCAGHSLGEYTALVAAATVSFEEGVRLVAERGEAMQAAAEERPGTMAALVGIGDDDALACCQRAEDEVWVANFNAPGQVVIAGSPPAVGRASELAKGAGARKSVPLPVGGAFHTPLMEPARQRLRKCLGATRFERPEVPVVANVDARPHLEAEEWPSLLSAQLCSPVRWRHTLEALAGLGASTLVEVGPGGVLTGLARRTLPSCRAVSVAKPDDLDALVDALAGDSPLHHYVAEHSGERLYMSERLILSPGAGLFQPSCPADSPVPVEVGGLVGRVGELEVRSGFAGQLMGLLALPGERVSQGQPVAWLRTGPEPGA